MLSSAWIVISVLIICFSLLLVTSISADAILICGVMVLVLTGVLEPAEALSGFANEGLITVAVLYVIARGMSQTGVVDWIASDLLGKPKNTASAQLRLMLPVAGLSAFLNNTPVVAMLIPAVKDWAKRHKLSVSQLMIPLSYAAIVGGTCTLIGTSTNLVVNDLLRELPQAASLKMFDLAWVGIPCIVVVIAFTLASSRWLLPSRGIQQTNFGDFRQYVIEMTVEPDSGMIGKSIEDAGLRQLPGVFLIEIVRSGRVIPAASPKEILLANDHLVFAGDVGSVVDLKNIRGLRLAEGQAFKVNANEFDRCLVEVVISNNFPTIGKTVKEGQFRTRYGAAIIAVSRDGQHIKARIGDIVLKAGDTLLLEAHEQFVNQKRYSRDFLMVGAIENSRPVQHQRRGLAAFILVSMIALAGSGVLSMLEAGFIACVALIVFRCLSITDARRSLDLQILLVIASAIAMGVGMEKTGASSYLAHNLISVSAGTAFGALVATFFITALFSALITNIAAALIMFPIVVAISSELQVSVMPFVVTLMVAASASFATPIGYQTNLMVYGPGEYRYIDFLRIGVPLTLLVGLVTVCVAPVIWHF